MKECVKENILINKVNSMGNSVPNIYKKLNEFNAILGKSPKYKISMVADKHIYIKMIYKENITENDVNLPKGLDSGIRCKDLYGMAKIFVTRNPITNEPRFILFNDSIYTNKYIMPNVNDIKKFEEAHAKYVDNDNIRKIKDYDVTLSKKLVNDAIICNYDKIKHIKSDIANAQPCDSLHLDLLKELGQDLIDAVYTLEILPDEAKRLGNTKGDCTKQVYYKCPDKERK